ncbi:MAG: FMN-binding protein [Endomicrobiales bacterium]
MTIPEGLKSVFPEADKIITVQKNIDDDQRERVKKKLGGKFSDWRAAPGSDSGTQQQQYTFYIAFKEERKIAVAFVEVQPGRWGPMEIMIVLWNDGSVKNAIVLSHNDTKARPVCRKSFLNQFKDKTTADPITIDKDIYAVTGATVSSSAVAFAVKKAIVLYQEFFLNGAS